MRTQRRSFLKSALAALFLFHASVGGGGELPHKEALTITLSSGKRVTFQVEVAATEAERQTGLMNRESMAADRGMLFDFGAARPVYMWMRDTYLPLDMLFIDAAGVIRHIRADTLPLSEDIIDSHGPVRFVLELNAGAARSNGIAIDDHVTSATIDPSAKP